MKNNNPSTNLFFDTEFTGLHQKTTLISIGILSECGRTFYAELTDYDKSELDEWLQTNVIANLMMHEPEVGEEEYYAATRHSSNPHGNDLYESYSVQLRCNMPKLKDELSKWLSQFNHVKMWSDCLAYDWVLFCNIFGTARDLPSNVYYIPFDIATLMHEKGIDPDISREEYSGICSTQAIQKHNALWDAQVIKKCYEKLIK
jgi:hypothetical protein